MCARDAREDDGGARTTAVRVTNQRHTIINQQMGPGSAVHGQTVDATPPRSGPALEAVYSAHWPFVLRSIRRLGVPRPLVEDLAQEVFVVVAEQLPTYRPTAKIQTWLFAIVFRVVRGQQRRWRRQARRVEPPLGASPPPPDEALARDQAAELLERLMDDLSPEQRAVFTMVELEDMSVPDIGEAMGLSQNTIHSRLRLARRKLERALARHHARDTWRLRWIT